MLLFGIGRNLLLTHVQYMVLILVSVFGV